MAFNAGRAGRKAGRLLVGAVRFHPRLFVALALGGLAFVATPWLWGGPRFLVAFDVVAASWIFLALMLVLNSDCAVVRQRAKRDDEGAWVALLVVFLVTLASLVAVVVEARGARDPVGGDTHVLMAVSTLALSWVFFHSLFAFHYAHEYYDEEADANPMLGFPGKAEPDYWDFLYFSFNFGTASQTADVTVNSPRLRRFTLLHQISSYVFNTAVLALGVNVAASLMGSG